MSWTAVEELLSLRDQRLKERKKRKLWSPTDEHSENESQITKWVEERRLIRSVCEGLKLPAPFETVTQILCERTQMKSSKVSRMLELIPGVTIVTVSTGGEEGLGIEWGVSGDARRVVVATNRKSLLRRFWQLSGRPGVPKPSRLPTSSVAIPKKENTSLPLIDRPTWRQRLQMEEANEILNLLETPTVKEKRALKKVISFPL